MSRLQGLERLSLGVAVVCGVLTLLSAGGCPTFEVREPGWAWPLHLLLLVLSAGAGVATMLRGMEIDRKRWEIVEDPLITSGERQYAHKEAERQRRWAGTVFALGPLLMGYWVAYQFRSSEVNVLFTDLLGVTPLAGFLAGLIYGRRFEHRPPG